MHKRASFTFLKPVEKGRLSGAKLGGGGVGRVFLPFYTFLVLLSLLITLQHSNVNRVAGLLT